PVRLDREGEEQCRGDSDDHHQQRLIGEIDGMTGDRKQRLVHAENRLDRKLLHRVQIHEPLSLPFSRPPAAISALISLAARITLRMPAAVPNTKNTIISTGLV